jgi:hypothetical protein
VDDVLLVLAARGFTAVETVVVLSVHTLLECVIVPSAPICTECKMPVCTECTRDGEGTLGTSILYRVFFTQTIGIVFVIAIGKRFG